MSEKTLLELTFEVLSASKKPLSFKELWAKIIKQKGLSEEEANKKLSQFYTSLLLDGKFVTLGENKWDLRDRHPFDAVHIDLAEAYNESDETGDDEDTEEKAEEKEYNQPFEEKGDDVGPDQEPDIGEEPDTPANSEEIQ